MGQATPEDKGEEVKKMGGDRPFLPKVAKPDSAVKEKAVKEINEKIERLIDERSKIDKQQQIVRAGNKPFHDKKKVLLNKRKDLRGKRDVLMKKVNELKTKIDSIQAKNKAKREKDKKAMDAIKFNSVEKIDARIGELEKRQERSVLSSSEEKALVKEITSLQKAKRDLKKLNDERKGDSTANTLPQMRDEKSETLKIANGLLDKIKNLSSQLDELTQENSAAQQKADKLQNKRMEIQKQIDELFTKRNDIKKEHSQQWKAYKSFLDELNKIREQERKEREEQQKKEREEYERKLEEEEAKKKPWEEEIALCDFLIHYLKGLSGGNKKVVTSAVSATKEADISKPRENKEFDGLKAVGKKNTELEEFMVMGGGKPKSKKKKSKKKDDRLTHSMDLLGSFSLLSLTAPTKLEAIPESIKKLEEKRAHYDVLPRAPRKKADASNLSTPPANEPASGAGSGNSNNKKKKKSSSAAPPPSVDSSELFPILPGSKSPSNPRSVTPSNGPSAVDMVKSNGTPTSKEVPAIQQQGENTNNDAEEAN